ncbi:redoxin domain-containing protein [Candidatus Carsonella ruddii]|uniref:Alkyl hydroperoxide reductase C n=1 Tax=Carsonella ruddii TaxID=114186 RepID=A0A1U9RSV9_CARRU|nr:redoxin domain-containing protein [Candidatus Carsonella ruddii]AQU89545.1 Alkyl hydroperoxide reductase protein C [Candidatus Carsonella ruddii]
MLNTRIKSFKTIAYFKNKFFEINEKHFKNKWNVLFFFPYSYSFICPTELKDISENIIYFNKKNINIYAISTDSHFSQKNWIEQKINFVNFPFISDFNHQISKNLNILNKKDGNCFRSTIILDPNLIIKSIDIIDSSISRSIKYLLNRLDMLCYTNLNNNELCPYSWNTDKKSIKIDI